MSYDFVLVIVGGIVMIAILAAVLWLLMLVLIDVVDWLAGVIERALRNAANRW